MDKYDGLKLENQLCFPLYAASREVIKKYRPYLEKLDLTYTQYITMMLIWEHRTISVHELGEKLLLDSGTLTPVLKSLQGKGYITRTRGKEDERVLYASVTEKGDELRERAVSVPSAIAGCVKLTPDEAATLYKLLYKLMEQT